MRPAPGVRGGDQGEQEIPSRSPFSRHSPTSGALHRCAASKGLATRRTLTAFRMVFPSSPDQRGGQYLLLPKRSVDELLFHILHGEERPKLVGGRPETPVRLSLSCLLSPFSSPAISTALNSTPAPAQVGTAGQGPRRLRTQMLRARETPALARTPPWTQLTTGVGLGSAAQQLGPQAVPSRCVSSEGCDTLLRLTSGSDLNGMAFSLHWAEILKSKPNRDTSTALKGGFLPPGKVPEPTASWSPLIPPWGLRRPEPSRAAAANRWATPNRSHLSPARLLG